MAYIAPRKPKTPQYKGTVVCAHCEAEYTPSENWYRGYHTKDTTGRFNPMYKLDKDQCPCCLKKVK